MKRRKILQTLLGLIPFARANTQDEIPLDFIEALEDMEAGRLVDMETVLSFDFCRGHEVGGGIMHVAPCPQCSAGRETATWLRMEHSIDSPNTPGQPPR